MLSYNVIYQIHDIPDTISSAKITQLQVLCKGNGI